MENKWNRISFLLLVFIFSCEHFHGRLLDPKSLLPVPDLLGRWSVIQDGKESSLVRISFNQETKTFLVEIEGEIDRSHLRFTHIGGKTIGEYHDVSENGEEMDSGHIFLLQKTESGWKVVLGSDISKQMVTKHNIVAKPHKSYGKNPPSYFLSGNREENTKALVKLIHDPDFFQIENLKKVMFLQSLPNP